MSAGRRRLEDWPLSATSTENELADALTDEAIKTIISAMNGLPDDVMSYVMAYTPVRNWGHKHDGIRAIKSDTSVVGVKPEAGSWGVDAVFIAHL